MAFTEDLTEFFETDDFAVTATVASSSVDVIYDDPYSAPFDEVESSDPSILCRTTDVSAVDHGDAVEVEGNSYTVAGIQPNGTGVTRLQLKWIGAVMPAGQWNFSDADQSGHLLTY